MAQIQTRWLGQAGRREQCREAASQCQRQRQRQPQWDSGRRRAVQLQLLLERRAIKGLNGSHQNGLYPSVACVSTASRGAAAATHIPAPVGTVL